MFEAMLYEHEDGRRAVSFIVPAPFSDGDPKWHRVGPVRAYGVPAQEEPIEIDVPKLIADCYRMTEAAQGTAGCIAFYRGAQWMREQIIAQPQQPAPVVQEPMTWDQFKAETLTTLPGEYEAADFDAVLHRDRDVLMKGVRMVERFHNITGAKR